ncbi:MAG: TonB-dependent receptor plug domain-containing protein [Candidatus Cloacimonadales bacterium]
MKTFLTICLICCGALLFSTETEADSLQQKRKIYQLEGISVIAEKPQKSIGGISLKTYSPEKSVLEVVAAEAIDDFAGLHLAVGGKDGSELSIRGFSENQIKIMIDGRPLSSSYMDAVDLTTIPLTKIKEIQVLKGPISALYGSDNMGGVINIITKSPSKKREIILGSQFRRNNTHKFYADISQKLGAFDYALSASRYQTDGFMLPLDFEATPYENGAVRNKTARIQYDLQSKINFEIWDFHKIGLQFAYSNLPKKEIVSSIYENLLREFTAWERYQASLAAFIQVRHNLENNLQIYYDQNNDTYVEYNTTGDLLPGWPSDLESWTFGLHDYLEWEINNSFSLTNGIRYEKSAYNRRDKNFYLNWTSDSVYKMHYFAQTEWEVGDFSSTFSSGLAWFKLQDHRGWDWHWLPSIGFYYSTPRNLKISLASGLNTTYPTMKQLFSSSSGNADLQEERAWKNELTLEQPFAILQSSGNLHFSVYYNRIDGLIERLGGIYTNQNEIDSYGFESRFGLQYLWEHEIQYAYLDFSPQSAETVIRNPRHSLMLRESFTLPFDLKFSYQASWKDLRHTEISSIKLPAYWLHSLQLHKKFQRYKIGLALENLFDKSYQDKYGYPAPGFNFVVNFEVKI